jgi:hypothetical protein
MIRKLLSIAFLLGLLSTTVLAQQKPDFSGTWKLNVAKSDFGNFPGPSSRTDEITHKEPAIAVNVNLEGPQGKLQFTANYTTDGKEVTNKMGDREVKAVARWDGNNLLINSKFNINDAPVTATATWSLGADGKTFTINVHFTSAMGDVDQKLVFEKQESVAPAAPEKKP